MSATISVPATIQVREICARLETSEELVYRMLNDGTIPSLRVGRKWLISRARYEQWEANFGHTAVA